MTRRNWFSWSAGVLPATILVAAVSIAAAVQAADPLPTRIDQMVESASPGGLAPVASDVEFVRRLYLDLTGRVPTAPETRAFLDLSLIHI